MISFFGDYVPVHPLEISSRQCCIGNIECAFADSDTQSGKAYTSVLALDCLEKSKEDISAFAALNLANNHVYDAGNFEETYSLLSKLFPAIQFFGTKGKPYAELHCGTRKIAIIGCLEQCRSRGSALFPEEQVLTLIRQLKPAFQKIYVYPHWGKESEYTRYPSPRQIKLAHRWIDAGADGVFGHHSHVYQGKELYQGKPVYYSLGNFFFPHPESALYDGTHTGMTLEVDPDSDKAEERFHAFDDGGIISVEQEPEKRLLDEISAALPGMTYRKWAQKIGAFYLHKNMASWKIRIRKNPLVNLPKFLIWAVLPKTMLFFVAGIGSTKR